MLGLTDTDPKSTELAIAKTHELLRAMLLDANNMNRSAMDPDRERMLRRLKLTMDTVTKMYSSQYAGMSVRVDRL